MIKKTLIGSTITALMLVGCGSSTDSTTTSTTSTTGYFVDAAVVNLDYDCIADGVYNNTTGIDGAFTCQNMNNVRFRIGNLILGDINTLPADGYVFPQDVVGVARTDIYNEQVTEMARLLQSVDSDIDPNNGITIEDTTKIALDTSLDQDTVFNATETNAYLELANKTTTMTQTQARVHLDATLQATIQTSTTSTIGTTDTTTATTSTVSTTTLPADVQETIEYMVNEEKLAYDLYLNLYYYHSNNSATNIFQLQNIALNSEITHMQLVEGLANKYGLAIASTLPSGTFDIPVLQSLYDALYTKGTISPIDALKSACMVEVTDINDLNRDIIIAQNANAQDVVDTFTILRDGSYTHYWSFDSGLKAYGVSDGCCSLGTIDGVNYCHLEYPQNTQGNQGQGRGQGRH